MSELEDAIRKWVAPAIAGRATHDITTAASRESWAIPLEEDITCIADDNTQTHLPREWIDAAIKSLDNRWDRGWTGGTISTVAVVAEAFEAAAAGREPLMWEEEDDECPSPLH